MKKHEVPFSWEKCCLGDGIELVSGQHMLANTYDSDDKGIPYLTGPADFNGESIVATKFTKIPNVMCEAGDILITVKGSGAGSMVIADNAYCISRQLMAIRSKNWNMNFIHEVLRKYENELSSTASGLIPGISRNDLLQLPLLIPTLGERDCIGNVSKLTDSYLSLYEKIIKEKVELKKGLMQQLISGKKRFSSFPKPWRTVHLGELFSNRVESSCEDLSLLSITSKGGVVNRDTINKKDSSNKDKSRYLRICPGDIGYNTMRMWQGVSGLSSLEGIVSPAYTVVTPDNSVDAEFMAVFFKYPPTINLFRRYSQGLVDDTLNLKFHHFSKIEVTIPEKEEQIKIASIFKVLDQELVILNKKLAALKEQKKGLMQQLLTGKKRVKVKDVA